MSGNKRLADAELQAESPPLSISNIPSFGTQFFIAHYDPSVDAPRAIVVLVAGDTILTTRFFEKNIPTPAIVVLGDCG
jgi:hypothetical protein